MTAAERAKAIALLRKLRAAQDTVDLLGGEIAGFADSFFHQPRNYAHRNFARDLHELSTACYGGTMIACIEAIERRLAS